MGQATKRIEHQERYYFLISAITLTSIGEDATHLVVRARMETTPEWKEWLLGRVLYPPVHGLTSAVQLKNLKRMAERDARARIEMHEVA